MGLKIKEAADTAGVSVRTLHHYDKIGLLIPDEITESGYRLYSSDNLERLQQIRFFRELDFSLSQIRSILENPDYERTSVLRRQKDLLIERKLRLDAIISLVEKTISLTAEGKKMERNDLFEAFDMNEIEKHRREFAAEAEEIYGRRDSYKESIRRTSKYTESRWKLINKEAKRIYERFADLMERDVPNEVVRTCVEDWQRHISRYYYDCTDEILKGLGELYISDERFQKNIDRIKPGLSTFMSRAIADYCR